MGVLVQKFGGTSVQSIDKMYEVCKIIKSYKEKDFDLVIVVSAMGRTGDPYATDTLINLAKTVNKNPQKRELDTLMSCGEIISGTIFTNLLISEGIDAVFLNGGQAGILTDDNFSNAKILDINPKKIKEELQKGKVVVIAGFQGKTKENDLTTLGRGGSDTSAVAIGKALNCDTVEIYTDVDGVMTADPRVEPNAKVLEHIGYEEVFQMADKGAKVIHPRAVQLAKSGNITLIIKNTLNPLAKGTSIGLMRCGDDEKLTYEEYTSVNTAVAHQDKFSQVKITSKEEVFLDILTTLEEENVSIDMINFFVNYKAFIIGEEDVEKVESILNKFEVKFDITKDCAKVTLIGAEIMGIPGIMSKVAKSISRYNI